MKTKITRTIISSFVIVIIALIANIKHQVKFDHAEACFTPSEKCTPFILQIIKSAQRNIYIQAYTWTSQEISEMLVIMKNRGVKVHIIVDKVNLHKNKSIKFLQDNGIAIMIDYVSGIAHNKIIIIDDHTVITGSFNFSKAADTRNVENVLKIQSPKLTQEYLKNWEKRKQLSQNIDNVVANKNVYKPWKERYIRS